MENLSEYQAIQIAKKSLENVCGPNWTFSLMTEKDANDFIWSYLYNNQLQYLKPIKYGLNKVVICHQD